MPQPLLFLAYASNASVSFSPGALVDLLAVSRRNNERARVTGMLLFRGGNFLQALEGPEESVRSTFERIAADLRHGSVGILLEEPLEARVFADWSMAFEDLSTLDLATHPGASRYLHPTGNGEQARMTNDHHVIEFFTSFRANMR